MSFIKKFQAYFVFIIVVTIFFPNFSFADLKINEIMYDAEGTDSGREWVEFTNFDGDQADENEIDLLNYKFLENNVNHGLKIHEYSGNSSQKSSISAGEYAIIADNPAKFLIDYPNFSGILLDSAFSLSNVGENIAIVDSENNIIHAVNYSPEWGAKGTGNTLQLNGSDWVPAKPTPGIINATTANDETKDDSDDDSNSSDDSTTNSGKNGTKTNENNANSQSAHSGQNDLTNEKEKNNLSIGAGRVRYGIINSPVEFRAISNLEKKNKVKYEWSFGDTDSQRGTNPDHTYYSEGVYNVVLNGEISTKDTEELATSRTKVHIRKPTVDIMLITRGETVDIMLKNDSDFEVNFGGFYFILSESTSSTSTINLKNSKKTDQSFFIAKDTILDKRSEITVSGDLTEFNLVSPQKKTIVMYYPNGKIAVGPIVIEKAKSIETGAEIRDFIESIKPFVNVDKYDELENIIQMI